MKEQILLSKLTERSQPRNSPKAAPVDTLKERKDWPHNCVKGKAERSSHDDIEMTFLNNRREIIIITNVKEPQGTHTLETASEITVLENLQ